MTESNGTPIDYGSVSFPVDPKDRYSVSYIRKLLEGYKYLSEAKMPSSGKETGYTDYGTTIQRSLPEFAHFEKPEQLKSDIDKAIQSLRPTEKFVILTLSIDGWTHYDVAYWLGIRKGEEISVVNYIETSAIIRMSQFLNKKVGG